MTKSFFTVCFLICYLFSQGQNVCGEYRVNYCDESTPALRLFPNGEAHFSEDFSKTLLRGSHMVEILPFGQEGEYQVEGKELEVKLPEGQAKLLILDSMRLVITQSTLPSLVVGQLLFRSVKYLNNQPTDFSALAAYKWSDVGWFISSYNPTNIEKPQSKRWVYRCQDNPAFPDDYNKMKVSRMANQSPKRLSERRLNRLITDLN